MSIVDHVIHELIMQAVKYPGEHVLEQSGHLLSTFVAAATNGLYEDALTHCTPQLQAVIRKQGLASLVNLAHCFALQPEAERRDKEVHPLRGSCSVRGILKYPGGDTAEYKFEFLRNEQGWKLNGYDLGVMPKAARSTPLPVEHQGLAPLTSGDCPAGCPVKVSRSGIFHTESSRFYRSTRPVLCFATPTDATKAGYRPCK